jgi:hypothetical protein
MAHEEDDEEYWAREATRRGIHIPKESEPDPLAKKAALPLDKDEDDEDLEEEEEDPDFPSDKDELRRKFLKKKAGTEEEESIPTAIPKIPAARPGSGSAPVGPGPGGAKTPPPAPTVAAAPPAKPGECCGRMKKEVAERTNVTLYKDIKDNDIVVFAHNYNKILHCPWCGAKI